MRLDETARLKWLRRIGKEWFLLGMLAAVIAASVWPEFGASGGAMHAEIVVNAGVALVFFLHGVGLPLASLRRGLLAWRVHVVVQMLTYLVFPLLWIIFNAALKDVLPRDLLLGFCLLAALPSTISSSVALTALARGDVPVAIFNATLSSLLGIVLTPLLINLLGDTEAHGLTLGATMLNIAQLLLLPLVAGQLLRPLIATWYSRVKHHVSHIDRLVILLLVYAAFCNSVKSGLWREHGFGLIVTTLLGAAFFLGVVLVLSTTLARRLQFNRGDEIAAVFCGSKKTLASGIPLAALIFGSHPGLGMIVLPVMLYHQLQLFVCSALAYRYARAVTKVAAPERT